MTHVMTKKSKNLHPQRPQVSNVPCQVKHEEASEVLSPHTSVPPSSAGPCPIKPTSL